MEKYIFPEGIKYKGRKNDRNGFNEQRWGNEFIDICPELTSQNITFYTSDSESYSRKDPRVYTIIFKNNEPVSAFNLEQYLILGNVKDLNYWSNHLVYNSLKRDGINCESILFN